MVRSPMQKLADPALKKACLAAPVTALSGSQAMASGCEILASIPLDNHEIYATVYMHEKGFGHAMAWQPAGHSLQTP